jgi:hypothetical protein
MNAISVTAVAIISVKCGPRYPMPINIQSLKCILPVYNLLPRSIL